MPDDETIAQHVMVIGGKRWPDDFTMIWRDLPIGRGDKSSPQIRQQHWLDQHHRW